MEIISFVAKCLLNRSFNWEFLVVNWRSLLRKVYSRHHDLADRVVVYICLTNDHGYAIGEIKSDYTPRYICRCIDQLVKAAYDNVDLMVK
jgi:hypothetical protein